MPDTACVSTALLTVGQTSHVPGPAQPVTDPRDSAQGLRADAPLLDGWLLSTELSPERGALTSMCTPGAQAAAGSDRGRGGRGHPAVRRRGHDQARRYAARRRRVPGRAALGRGLVPVLGGGLHARQPGPGPRGRRPGAREIIVTRSPAPVPLLGLVAGGPAAGVGAAGTRPGDRAARRRRRGDRPCRPRRPSRGLRGVPRRPSYVGTIGDLGRARGCRARGGCPASWTRPGLRYLGFHPDLPPHAIAAGADGMVTSAHKALPASTQAALVLARTQHLDRARARPRLRGHPHHQPGGSDHREHRRGARAAGPGRASCRAAACCGWWPDARRRLAEVLGVGRARRPGVDPASWWCCWLRRRSGRIPVEADLIAAGMPVELGDRDMIVPIITVADTEDTVERFTATLAAAIERAAARRGVPIRLRRGRCRRRWRSRRGRHFFTKRDRRG